MSALRGLWPRYIPDVHSLWLPGASEQCQFRLLPVSGAVEERRSYARTKATVNFKVYT